MSRSRKGGREGLCEGATGTRASPHCLCFGTTCRFTMNQRITKGEERQEEEKDTCEFRQLKKGLDRIEFREGW